MSGTAALGLVCHSAELEPLSGGGEKHLLKYVELAHQLEAEYCVALRYHFSLFMDDVFASLIRTFTPVVQLAEKYDIPIGIENMNKVHEDCEIAYLGGHRKLARVFDACHKVSWMTLTWHTPAFSPEDESFIKAFPTGSSAPTSATTTEARLHLPVERARSIQTAPEMLKISVSKNAQY